MEKCFQILLIRLISLERWTCLSIEIIANTSAFITLLSLCASAQENIHRGRIVLVRHRCCQVSPAKLALMYVLAELKTH